ncbi:HNH endonuclease [Caldibacillus thermoamylovorans]|nr:HNH endonuclease [Caldibacillus thermoamylovorans]
MKKQTKVCSHCQTEKPINQFYDSSRYMCIECERVTARERMRQTKNRLRTALRDSKKTAAKYGCYDDLTIQDLTDIYEFFDGYCPYCDKPITADQKFSIDHIRPLSKSGANTRSNTVLCHLSCNLRKKDKAVAEIFGAAKAAEIAEYSAFLRADDEVVAKCREYLNKEAAI